MLICQILYKAVSHASTQFIPQKGACPEGGVSIFSGHSDWGKGQAYPCLAPTWLLSWDWGLGLLG